MGKHLSKSKLLAYRQCPKRLWLEVHRPELRADSAAAQASFAIGYQVGEMARMLYDPKGKGVLLDAQTDGYAPTFARTQELLAGKQPIFEAGFRIDGALAFADVLLPVRKGGKAAWRMVEVKSSTEVKDYHRDDAAIQSYVARSAGLELASIALAHIDSDWVYPGNGDYDGLLVEEDLTKEAFARAAEVRAWLQDAHKIVASNREPKVAMGEQCGTPFECGFCTHCGSQQPQAKHPISQLPRKSPALKAKIIEHELIELRDVPDDWLNPQQQRVKKAALTGKTYFDKAGAKASLAAHKLPAYFMDFETCQFAVPVWKGTRPYQTIPFQFSVHRLARSGKLEHQGFLDVSGNDPSLAFAKALIAACGERGPIFVYNASFEMARIKELAARFPKLKQPLLALNARVVDLLPVARENFYHPSQQGSWSIKAVLPAMFPNHPELDYAKLEGVQHGGMAMEAYAEAIRPDTTPQHKAEIERQLTAYCALDTLAMVRMWEFFQ